LPMTFIIITGGTICRWIDRRLCAIMLGYS
jgi:hypothetical protein